MKPCVIACSRRRFPVGTAMLSTLLPVLFLFWTAAGAAEDEMELQRCVWSCLSAHGPNTNPEYHACVAEHCTKGDKPAANVPEWSSGSIEGGRTHYAGVDNAAGDLGLYYFCNRNGRSELVLVGVEGPAATLALEADGRRFPLSFSRTSDRLVAPVLPDAHVLSALRAGTMVKIVRTSDDAPIAQLRLDGSSRAIRRASRQCR